MPAGLELLARLVKAASEAGGRGLDRVGEAFMQGAAQPGTFRRGKDFAKTPEGLASQFDFGPFNPLNPKWDVTALNREPDLVGRDPVTGREAMMFPHTFEQLAKYANAPSAPFESPGLVPHVQRGNLPRDAKYYIFSTGDFKAGSGAGSRAYPTMYGMIANDPNSFNIKDSLTGSNTYRNNYHMASAIMRDPQVGQRLLPSPEQFTHIDFDDPALAQFRHMPPESQVGLLQTEAAFQTLARLGKSSRANELLSESPLGVSSSIKPGALQALVQAGYPSNPNSFSALSGPGALKKLGVVSDVLQGRDVDPQVFKGLEYCGGGPVPPKRY